MVLHYHKGKNVGDAINQVVFEHFLGTTFFDGDAAECLLGIGSIIGLKGDVEGKKVVFTSGWGDHVSTYGPLPVIDGSWDVRAVRGPLTASALGLSPQLALLDGAYLIQDVWPRELKPIAGRIGFIPHHKSHDFYGDWAGVCAEAGLELLDVTLEPRAFMESLWRCERVVSEAMHGAIFADTYNIPWMPIKLYGHINEFKWKDWWGSVGLEPTSHSAPTKLHTSSFFAELINNRGLPKVLSRWSAPVVAWKRRRSIVTWLQRIRAGEFYCSDRNLLVSLIGELRVRFDQLKRDYERSR